MNAHFCCKVCCVSLQCSACTCKKTAPVVEEFRYSKDTSGGQIKRLRDMADGARLYKVPDADQFARTLDDIANRLVANYSAGVPEGYKLVAIDAPPQPAVNGAGLSDALRAILLNIGNTDAVIHIARKALEAAPDAQARPWPMEVQPDGTTVAVDPADLPAQARPVALSHEQRRAELEPSIFANFKPPYAAPTAPPAEAQPAPAAESAPEAPDMTEDQRAELWAQWSDAKGPAVNDKYSFECGIQAAYEHFRNSRPTFCEYCGGNDETPPDHCMDCERPVAPLSEVLAGLLAAWELNRRELLSGSSSDPWGPKAREDQAEASGMDVCIKDLRAAIAATSAGEEKS